MSDTTKAASEQKDILDIIRKRKASLNKPAKTTNTEPRKKGRPRPPKATPAPQAVNTPKPEPKPKPKPKPAPKPAPNASAVVDALANALNPLLQPQQVSFDEDTVRAIVADMVKNEIQRTEVVTVTHKKKQIAKVEGAHSQLATLLRWISAINADGYRPNIYLTGEKGAGKSTLVKQAAQALDLDFYTQGCVATAYELIGNKDAHGNYAEPVLYKAFKHGGVYLSDENDGCNERALIAINQMLANDLYTFPNGETVTKHKDFIFIAAGNTNGSGATSQFNSRRKLDDAYLDRFKIIKVNVCPNVLRQIMLTAYSNNVECHTQIKIDTLITRVYTMRMKCEELGYSNTVGVRSAERAAMAYALEDHDEKAALAELLQGFSEDEQFTLEVA